jgi:hypothetical protein
VVAVTVRSVLAWLPGAAAGLALLVLPAHPAAAQVTGSAGAGAHFQYFGFSDDAATGLSSVHLLTIPVAARADLGGGVAVDLTTAWASGSLERAGGESISLSGITDTRLRVGWTIPAGWLTVAAVGVAPTGAESFTPAEAELAGVVAADLLPFRVSHWGSGGGAGGAVSAVHSTGLWGFGGSASFLVPGTYEPVADPGFDYRPGAQVSLRGVVDRRVGPGARASLSLAYHHHGDDQVDRENLFRAGDRFQAVGSWAFPAGATGSAVVYGGYLHRAQGTFLQELGTRSSQGFILLGAGFRHPTSLGILVPSSDLRVVRREDGENQGWMLAVGSALERSSGDVQWAPTLMARVGSVRAREGVSTGVTGVEAGLRVAFGGSRR